MNRIIQLSIVSKDILQNEINETESNPSSGASFGGFFGQKRLSSPEMKKKRVCSD